MFKVSIRTEKTDVGSWSTDFNGTPAEAREYLKEKFGGLARVGFTAGRFRCYGGEGATRAKMGIRELTKRGVF